MPNITIHGEFVDLLPLEVGHAALTLAWRGSERAANLNRGATSVAQQEQWIASRPADEYNFVICLKDGRPVGMVSLLNINMTHRHGEPARFLIGDEEAVRGVPAAVEAMKLIYELAFDTLGLRRISGTVVSENKLMAKWQRYLGMTEEGRMRKHFFINGKIQDAILFGMLDDEYRARALPRMKAFVAAGRNRAVAATVG
jgi:RimJ/RimL family protein N-acetyltransferase